MGKRSAAKRNINLNLDGDLAAWVAFAAALSGVSQTRYINEAIRGDFERQDAETLAAFEAFREVRGSERPGRDRLGGEAE